MLDIRDHGGLFGGVDRNKYKRWASGTVTSSSTGQLFYLINGSSVNFNYVTVTGMQFKPSLIYMVNYSFNEVNITVYSSAGDSFYPCTVKLSKYNKSSNHESSHNLKGDVAPVSVTNTGFVLPITGSTNSTTTWIAFE